MSDFAHSVSSGPHIFLNSSGPARVFRRTTAMGRLQKTTTFLSLFVALAVSPACIVVAGSGSSKSPGSSGGTKANTATSTPKKNTSSSGASTDGSTASNGGDENTDAGTANADSRTSKDGQQRPAADGQPKTAKPGNPGATEVGLAGTATHAPDDGAPTPDSSTTGQSRAAGGNNTTLSQPTGGTDEPNTTLSRPN